MDIESEIYQIEQACKIKEWVSTDEFIRLCNQVMEIENDQLKSILLINLNERNHQLVILDVPGISSVPQVLKEFIWIEQLKLGGLDITSISNIPYSVKLLHVLDCKLCMGIEKDEIPPNVEQLNISNNQLNFLNLANLPPNILALHCNNNKITEMFNGEFLTKIIVLKAVGNQLEHLPNFSPSLQKLDVSRNNLKSIDNLSSGIKEVDCSANSIEELVNLPIGLTKLIVYKNNIKRLDLVMFPNLMELDVSYNKSIEIVSLPPGLVVLDLSSNKMTTLNTWLLPMTLKDVNITDNPFPRDLLRNIAENLYYVENLVSDYDSNEIDPTCMFDDDLSDIPDDIRPFALMGPSSVKMHTIDNVKQEKEEREERESYEKFGQLAHPGQPGQSIQQLRGPAQFNSGYLYGRNNPNCIIHKKEIVV